jgi:thiamine biosynthesis protein ThiI
MPKQQKFILKLFPEIMVKGTQAKRQMVGQLYNNLITMLSKIDSSIEVKKFSDKIEVFTPLDLLEATQEVLLNTSGIEQVLAVEPFESMETLDAIKQCVGEVCSKEICDKRFVVRVKRSGKHSFNSTEMERTIGGYLLATYPSGGVDLHNPEVTLKIELINNQLNIITQRYQGLSGFPLGTQGDILSLMSGGFDSTIASYLTMKRGIKTHFIFFNLGGIAHEIGVKQVALYLWSRFGSSHRIKFISIPFEGVVDEIFRSTHPSYMGVILKRLMLQASEKIANELEIDALVTGESVAQVSSQTLRNLALIDQATDILTLRPLATMNKPDIMRLADEIGTRHFAESMPEYCGVISKNPITHGSFKRIEKEAKRFDEAVLEQAIASAEYLYVDEIVENINQAQPIEVVSTLKEEDIVIDIRSDVTPITTPNKTLHIPFYQLNKAFKKLDSNASYLLYCDKGIMSQLHAQYLKDQEGVTNLKVYRPQRS